MPRFQPAQKRLSGVFLCKSGETTVTFSSDPPKGRRAGRGPYAAIRPVALFSDRTGRCSSAGTAVTGSGQGRDLAGQREVVGGQAPRRVGAEGQRHLVPRDGDVGV